MNTPASDPILDRDPPPPTSDDTPTDEAMEAAFIDALDRAAGRPPRRSIPAGECLLREDESAEGLWLILEGEIRLTRRVEGQQVVLDDDASGRIIGLLSLVARGRAYFTCQAVTNVTAVRVPWETLDALLTADPSLSRQFFRQLLRSMGSRVRRIVDLQASVQRLNEELRGERDRLADALKQLSAAQARLIETGRMATLGQLVAGIAHELNNPVTVIRRTADYILEDVSALVGELPEHEGLLAMITSALTTAPPPTELLRQREASLAASLGDPDLARRLVAVGICTRDEYDRWFATVPKDRRAAWLGRLEAGFQLGAFLRNLQGAAERIGRIVGSLRGYARTQVGAVGDVNVNKTLEDTLLLFAAGARLVTLTRRYGDIPTIEADPGQLGQVWSNIIANALEAVEGRGELVVETDAPAAGVVRVRFTDNGPGIKPEHLARVFDLNFTTKHNPTSFGLGMGLVICRQIVMRHEGRIEVESQPGRTCFSITLPTRLSEEAKQAIEAASRAGPIDVTAPTGANPGGGTAHG